jgi:hypothetical protein
MSHRLTTAVRISKTAKAVLRKTQSFPERAFDEHDDLGDIGVEPMLLALAMELALKAWFVFDYDDPDIRGHDLSALFDRLKPESQKRLDAEFKASIVPMHPNLFFVDYGIRHILYQHRNAFIDWRYVHERKTMSFEHGAFEATLVMVLKEFDKRYRTEPVKSVWQSSV